MTNVRVNITTNNTTPAPTYRGWRVLHIAENPFWPHDTPPGMPEVMPPLYPRTVDMTREIQWMSYYLMRKLNPYITALDWTHVHNHDKAFTNFNGFGDDTDPRANFILNQSTTEQLPKYDKAGRLCGGTFVTGDAVGYTLVMRAGVHGIDPFSPMPDTETIIAKHWFTYALSVNKEYTRVNHFPQGIGPDGNEYPVAIPIIFKGTITFNINCFERWEQPTLPDPLKMYR